VEDFVGRGGHFGLFWDSNPQAVAADKMSAGFPMRLSNPQTDPRFIKWRKKFSD
jgi:hypothetical protein